jgi:hypothetical protein
MTTVVEGAIRLGEANGAAFRSNRRASGQSWVLALVPGVVIAVIGGLLGAFSETIKAALQIPTEFSSVFGPATFLVAVLVMLPLYYWLLTRMAVRRLRRRVVVDPVPFALSLDDEAFSYAIGQVVHVVRWPAVSDLFPAGKYWVIVAQGARYFVPRRVFADPAAERAVIASFLGHMAEPARVRAKEAAAMVAKAG